MGNNITYLFGAGASCNVLPLVKNMAESLTIFIAEFEENTKDIDQSVYFGNNEVKLSTLRNSFLAEITDLLQIVRRHYSIDTYAKKLFISGKEKAIQYQTLKNLLSCFFIAEQLKNNVDMRYDSFLAALVSKKTIVDDIQLPGNLKIVSWNYDFQFEKAFAEYYSDTKDIQAMKESLNIVDRTTNEKKDLSNQFGIIKLNGTAEWSKSSFRVAQASKILYANSGFKYDQLYFGDLEKLGDIYLKTLIIYGFLSELSYAFDNGIRFAWEEDEIVNIAKDATSETEILVVLGYSFPYFNRETDRKLIRNMAKLKKIYYQAESLKACEIISTRSKAIRDDINNLDTELVADPEQFFLPHEL